MEFLPEGYEGKCKETKTIQRSREIKNAKDLMKLCLIYLSQNCSLIEISELAKALGIAEISDVAFMKKFAKCGEWFKWILKHLEVEEITSYEKPVTLEEYQVVAVDASSVVEKGATKRRFKLHYGIDLFALSSTSHQITTEQTGESLRNFNIQPKDLVLGDRAYGTKTSIECCLGAGGDFIFRIKNKAFKLYDENRNEVSLLSFLKKADETKATETTVYMINAKKELVPLRLCALRKSADEIKKAEKKLKRKESKGQYRFSVDGQMSFPLMVQLYYNRLKLEKLTGLYMKDGLHIIGVFVIM